MAEKPELQSSRDGGSGRKIRQNPLYPPQPGVKATMTRRGQSASASPTTTPTAKKTNTNRRSSLVGDPSSPATSLKTAVETVAPAPKEKIRSDVDTSPAAAADAGAAAAAAAAATASSTSSASVATPISEPSQVAATETVAVAAAGTDAAVAVAPSSSSTAAKTNTSGTDTEEETGETKKDRKLRVRIEKELKDRLVRTEEYMKQWAEEREIMKKEINGLRDRLEEREFSNVTLEQKMKEREKECESLRKELETERKERERMEEKIKEVANGLKEINEKRVHNGGEERSQETSENGQVGGAGRKVKKCVVLTDSNGRGATHHSIMNHVPKDQRSEYEVSIVVAYTLEEAHQRISRGELSIDGSIVVVDNLTNDVRGTRQRPAATPEQLISRVKKLQGVLGTAAAAVICQVKPMQCTDVRPYNALLHDYLSSRKDHVSFGCKTQIRIGYLRDDGYHVKPQYDSIIDRTYACAILGLHVPCPTPPDHFVPDFVRRRFEREFPRLMGQDLAQNHGWRW